MPLSPPHNINRTSQARAIDPRLAVQALQSAHAGPIDLALGAGDCLAIQGASGSGKSVLLRMIADLVPCSGTLHLDGTAHTQWSGPAWRSMVTYQAAEPAWWAPTALRHLPHEQVDFARTLLPALHLAPSVLEAELGYLSTGERQRLALIRSLARKPKVLLLDEPAAALDVTSTLALEAVLRAHLDDGLSIILVTHSEQQAQRMATQTMRMVHGRLEPM